MPVCMHTYLVCQNSDGSWYKMDDKDVSSTRLSHVCAQAVTVFEGCAYHCDERVDLLIISCHRFHARSYMYVESIEMST